MNSRTQIRGALLGLAVGDALGAPIEMSLPGTFEAVTEMRGGGYFELRPGEWTDDTALALCSAESLIEKKRFDPHDHLTRYLKWYREGYMSTRSESFGVGIVTAAALMRFESTGESYCGPVGAATAHNGSLMCLAPIIIAYRDNYNDALEYAGLASRLTHGAPVAIDACKFLAHSLIRIFQGNIKDDVVSGFEAQTREIDKIVNTPATSPPQINEKNYANAAVALHTALWGFQTSNSFQEGLLKVVNVGWDADTMGAVYGQIAGAYYGEDGIPQEWRNNLFKKDLILELADALYQIKKIGPA